jgi:hypothetical protein
MWAVLVRREHARTILVLYMSFRHPLYVSFVKYVYMLGVKIVQLESLESNMSLSMASENDCCDSNVED